MVAFWKISNIMSKMGHLLHKSGHIDAQMSTTLGWINEIVFGGMNSILTFSSMGDKSDRLWQKFWKRVMWNSIALCGDWVYIFKNALCAFAICEIALCGDSLYLPKKSVCPSVRQSSVPVHSRSVVCQGPDKLIFSQRVILTPLREGLGKTRAVGFF